MWIAVGCGLCLLIAGLAIWLGRSEHADREEQVMTKEDAKYLAWWLKERAD